MTLSEIIDRLPPPTRPRGVRNAKTEAIILEALRRGHTQVTATAAACVSINAFNHWRRNDSAFAAAVTAAIEEARDRHSGV